LTLNEIDDTGQLRIAKVPAISLRQLRSALVINDCGSFRRAATILSVKHSALSRSIRQLEGLIGTAIFERSSGGLRPTPVGRSVLRIARLIMEQVDALVETGLHCSRGEAGRISIGFCTSISAGNLRATLLDFRKRFPNIELATVERSRNRLMNALRNGTLDVIISPGGRSATDNKILSLWSERVLISFPEDHALAAREVIYWTDLRTETVLLSQHDPGRELEDLLISRLVLPEDRPKIERHDVSRGIIKSLISMGLGVGLVMESDTGASFAGLTYRELRDGSGPSRIGFVAEWRASNEDPALKRFLQLLTERYPSPAGT